MNKRLAKDLVCRISVPNNLNSTAVLSQVRNGTARESEGRKRVEKSMDSFSMSLCLALTY